VKLETPPNPDELEVSIIGPGKGECVVVHLGENEWAVVDSCIPRDSNAPAALTYLENLGYDAVRRVRLIVATHWHDDHIRGLARLLESMQDAAFFCSMALNTDNFAILVEQARAAVQSNSGVDEFAEIFDLLLKNRGATPSSLVTPKFAMENRKLLYLPGSSRPYPVVVTALSPSDGTVKKAFKDISRWLRKIGGPQTRIVNRSPNHTSVVLRIEIGSRQVLLGADLENTNTIGEGWIAVLVAAHPGTEAGIFKVSHHGSENGDHPEIWTKLLVNNVVAVVTPFTGGVTRLPRSKDLQRIARRTDSLFCTSAGAGKPPSRDAVVDKTMNRVTVDRRVLEGKPGHVRVRWSLSQEADSPRIELFNGAYKYK
jgi:Metallo-beta-lactamase superfamily